MDTPAVKGQITATSPNFVLLDSARPDTANLVVAMVQARDAVERRLWAHPQEPTGEEWWADVLADPRAGKRERRTDLALKQAFYRLADERREIILVACSKCDWRAVFSRERTTRCPTYATISPRRVAAGSALIGIGAGCITSSRLRARSSSFDGHSRRGTPESTRPRRRPA
jgi:hypothetical protein